MHIYAYCDSLCEPNPGSMEGGIWAKLAKKDANGNAEKEELLFTDNVNMGYGTCNEAEYRALLSLLIKLKVHLGDGPYPAITVHSDSQLMTKQLNGLWKTTKGEIKALYNRVRQFQQEMPFTLKWIPREQNAVADGLAQERKLKGSGRAQMMEDGRFVAKRYTPCVELLADKEMARLLFSSHLVRGRDRLLVLIKRSDLYYPHITATLDEMLYQQQSALLQVPKINRLADLWVDSTHTLLKQHLQEMRDAAEARDARVRDIIDDFFYNLKTKRNEEDPAPVSEFGDALGGEAPEADYNPDIQDYIDNDNNR